MKFTIVCSILVLFLTGKLVLSSPYPVTVHADVPAIVSNISSATAPMGPPGPQPPIITVPGNETTTTTTTLAPTTKPVPPTTTPKPTPPPTTTAIPTTTTQSPSTSTTSTPTTPTTTPVSPSTTPSPAPDRKFDSPSFIGGFVLCMGLTAIAFISWKFYKARTERNYHTL